MMFTPREEPIVVRFLSYQFSRTINVIFNSLNGSVHIIQASSFGKILEITDTPPLSENSQKAWFRFAGKPIRFSLREFAIVIGLPCRNFPTKSKSKMKKKTSPRNPIGVLSLEK
ncbi:hypothetical protein IGI04_003190 [Brassica rapa subsp. trilocularis]|uniref:DUF1985 domain-containing protein n=1 Tax=Brassica rapa subsp. trilocularis TaxID=1813537 RepID=A0ABQ7NXN3_BRACM|nr:hypothetical protein IGI04_003190 [Brassica rapa subsp. trilocularis]